LRVYLGGTAGDDNSGAGIFAAGFSDSLTGLAFGFCCDRTGVEDDGVVERCCGCMFTHDFCFVRIQTAAKGDDLRGLDGGVYVFAS